MDNGKFKAECYYCGHNRVMWGLTGGECVCNHCYKHSIAFNNKKNNYAEIEFLKEQLKSCSRVLEEYDNIIKRQAKEIKDITSG